MNCSVMCLSRVSNVKVFVQNLLIVADMLKISIKSNIIRLRGSYFFQKNELLLDSLNINPNLPQVCSLFSVMEATAMMK